MKLTTWGPVLLAMAAAGCGSGGGAPAGGPGGAGTGTGTLTWKEDGAAHKALFAVGALVRSSAMDLFEVSGADSLGTGVAFGISAKAPLGPGTYTCAQQGADGVIVSLVYTSSNATTTTTSCSITLTALGLTMGARGAGTFSVALTLANGGAKTITAGQFELPVTVTQTTF